MSCNVTDEWQSRPGNLREIGTISFVPLGSSWTILVTHLRGSLTRNGCRESILLVYFVRLDFGTFEGEMELTIGMSRFMNANIDGSGARKRSL